MNVSVYICFENIPVPSWPPCRRSFTCGHIHIRKHQQRGEFQLFKIQTACRFVPLTCGEDVVGFPHGLLFKWQLFHKLSVMAAL